MSNNIMDEIEANAQLLKAIESLKKIGLSDQEILKRFIEKASLNNRFLIFVGDYYYPSVGFEGFLTTASTLDEAKSIIERAKKDWGSVVDIAVLEEVYFTGDIEDE